MKQFKNRVFKILMGIFAVYAILVATHKGEFWPFSIYPMFSQAGHPWTRAIVRDGTNAPDSLIWKTMNLEEVNGSTVPLKKIGVNQIDFANFMSKTKVWDNDRKKALSKMFNASTMGNSRWIICKVTGHLTDQDSVIVEAIPYFMVTDDTVFTNPTLPERSYTSH